MKIHEFKETDTDAAIRYMILKSILEKGVYTVEFKKVNGDLRKMPCTLKDGFVPLRDSELIKSTPFDPETMPVWCMDKQAWRSFKTMNVISVEEYHE